ncbi:MAG: RNA polymerase sigma-70 factor [Tannerella sp.]|jgi:RNA polymerase sigma-70 factor (ECF subfamily)|nr:RNA polymerase sigma-70 factor [Tannerella sp.]
MKKCFNIPDEATDKELFVRLHKSDENAFTVIYERYHKRLYMIACKYLKDRELAKDAVQQIFLKLWEYRTAQNIPVNLKSYLFVMLKNLVLNEIRNNLTATEKINEIIQASEEADNEFIAEIEKEDLKVQLYKAINNLPEQKKTVCLYKLEENLSNMEIAGKMQISIPTVKTHYSQALKLLRTYFHKIMIFIPLFCVCSGLLSDVK